MHVISMEIWWREDRSQRHGQNWGHDWMGSELLYGYSTVRLELDFTHAIVDSAVSSIANHFSAKQPMCDVLSRYLSNFRSAGQIASDADGLVNHFRRMLQNGEFWLRFDFVKSPPDGHCIIHSLKTCLNSYEPNCTTTYELLEMLSLECITRSARYLPCYYVGDISEFYQELEQYVRYKKVRYAFLWYSS